MTGIFTEGVWFDLAWIIHESRAPALVVPSNPTTVRWWVLQAQPNEAQNEHTNGSVAPVRSRNDKKAGLERIHHLTVVGLGSEFSHALVGWA